jgi:hypothetical protein
MGLAIGIVLGMAMDSIAVGIIIGIVIGTAMDAARKK